MTRGFEIPLSNHRALFGAFLAAHAIPDAIDLMFTGVGCKPKAQRQIAMHDRIREAGNKMVWSDVTDVQVIAGPVERLRNIVVETVRRRGGDVGLVLVTTSAAMEMTGTDVDGAIPAMRREADCPIAFVRAAGWNGDWYAGYASAVDAVLRLVPGNRRRTDRLAVNLVGYVFDRYECDHSANLLELQRILRAIGLTLHTTFLSGVPMRALLAAGKAGTCLSLPYFPPRSRESAPPCLRKAAPCVFPVGLGATARFLLEAARAARMHDGVAKRVADDDRDRIEPRLRIAREALSGIRVAVLADTPLAAGLVGLLRELGARPTLAALLDRTLGGPAAFRAALAAAGHGDWEGALIPDPTSRGLETACRDLRRMRRTGAARSPFELVLAPDIWLPAAATDGAARVEIGLPSNRRHAISPSPVVGFAGAVSLAQRLLDASQGVH